MKKYKLVCGDNVTALRKMPDNIIHLTVTSPPYDNLREYNGYSWDFEKLAKQLYRVTKPGGVVVWVVNDSTVEGSETLTSFKQALYFKEIGFNVHDTMIWVKPGFANPSSTRYHQIFEYMFVFSKGQPTTFNPIQDVKVKGGRQLGKNTLRKKDGTMQALKSRNPPKPYGSRNNVWKMNTISHENMCKKAQAHPAVFPKRLVNDHIISWSNIGDVVLDPFMGSGTTGLMALYNSRKFIGIEISQEYFNIALNQIESIPKGTLF